MQTMIEVANGAEMIVNGYAFTKAGSNVRVLNLNKPGKASVLDEMGEILETSMDDIEIDIVRDYYERNKKYMEG